MFIQLGPRPEEMFAVRRDDHQANVLRIDEAIVDGLVAPVKTEASDAGVYVPPDLLSELRRWLDNSPGAPSDWMFRAARGGCWDRKNYLNRILKPAANPSEGRSPRDRAYRH